MNPNARRRRGRPFRMEALEPRALLAAQPIAAVDVQQFAAILYPPGTPQPTAAEIRRETFLFRGVGHYTVGPGGFSDQALTIHGYGKRGTSNVSRRFKYQFVINEPASTAPDPVVTGNIAFVAGDYLQNSAQMILDFIGPTGSESGGLPTHLYWSGDANTASSGPFAETGGAYPSSSNFPSNYFNVQGIPTSPLQQGLPPSTVDNWGLGLGDATLRYIPDAHPQRGTLGSGMVILVMQGLRNGSGAQSQIDQQID